VKEESVALSIVEIEQRGDREELGRVFVVGRNFLEAKIKGFMVEERGP